uniref:Bloodthirsty-related gene family, member 1 n=1 Tax=Oryzias latipes TaxID=8090 RepID=A0A3P9JGN2_ORYLA
VASLFLSDDQFLCSICLDVFTNPSSIPCGHTFCMSCITRYWDQCEVWKCPLCKKSFPKRPILHVNRTLREITEQFKSMRGGVPVGNGKEDQTLRKGHRGGSGHLMEELKKKMHKKHHDKHKIKGSEQEIQEMIRERTRKIEEIKMSMTEMAVERETASSVCMFTMLTSAIERSQAELIEVMEISRRAAEQQADSMIKQLEREIEELQIRDRALGELAQSDDHLHCVKTFQTLSSPPPSKDWSGVSLNCDLGTSAVYRTLATMVKKFQEELQKVTESGPEDCELSCSTINHQDAVLVHFSKGGFQPQASLQVWCGDRHQHAADNPERFDRVVCVLGQQSISSGKHYWEVEVGGKTDWDLGVARQSISRKGKINYTPQNGFWFLSLRDNKYAFRTEPSIDVNLNLRPHKIGIFVDYEKGQVSFYNVDAKVHIYTFNDNFTENIYPFFSPCTNKGGKNDLPLIITPIVLTK